MRLEWTSFSAVVGQIRREEPRSAVRQLIDHLHCALEGLLGPRGRVAR